MIRQQISDEMKVAMRARDADRLTVLRFMWSEIKNKEIDAKHELNDAEIVEILRREVKRRSESIAQYLQAGRTDIVEKEEAELKLITVYLPEQMSREAVEAIVDQVLATLPDRDFGHVMRAVMPLTNGKADGKLVSEVVKHKIG